MADLSAFQITRRWVPANPDILQLFSFPTPNGIKISVALEEMEIPYEAHTVKLSETTLPEFLSLNPNNKIPAIIDPHGPTGKPMALWESGAILIYLAEKTGRFLSSDTTTRFQTLQWLMFQMGGVGPMFGQYGYFGVFAGKEIDDPRPRERYKNESKRLLKVLEQQLNKQDYLAGNEYSIADMATWPWIRAAKSVYDAEQVFDMQSVPQVMAWLERCSKRPASERSLNIPPREG